VGDGDGQTESVFQELRSLVWTANGKHQGREDQGQERTSRTTL
jgi:hypothetical protein